jgi:signal transduction histidine kinase
MTTPIATSNPSQPESCTASKGMLIRLSIFCSIAGLFWSAIYTLLAFPAHYLPLIYSVLSLIGLVYLQQGGRLSWTTQYQLFLILILPALVQVGLGGFKSGGLVILWSALAPLCATATCQPRVAWAWMAAFLLVLSSSVALEFSTALPNFSPSLLVADVHMLANIAGFLTVVFLLLSYSQKARMKHLLVLEEYNRKLLDLDRLKSEFLSTAAHELRTPLTSIKGFLRLLGAGEKLTNDQIEYVGIATDNAERLYLLVNDLLDMSKLESGLMPIEKTLKDPLIAFRHALSSVKPLADTKKIILVEDTPAVMAPLEADHPKLEQIAINLLGNALKFTPSEGQITLSVRSEKSSLLLVIRDTGPGMPPEVLAHIFDKFYMAPGTSSSGVKGTGLGLTISQKLAELHGGRIWAESTQGQGSSFHVTIPIP